jgi:hypothetical protein
MNGREFWALSDISDEELGGELSNLLRAGARVEPARLRTHRRRRGDASTFRTRCGVGSGSAMALAVRLSVTRAFGARLAPFYNFIIGNLGREAAVTRSKIWR